MTALGAERGRWVLSVERKARSGSFEADEVAPALVGACLVELLERGVGARHVRGVVLSVVDVHRRRVDVRLECFGCVGQSGERKGHEMSSG